MQTALAALRLRLAASRPPADAAALVAEIEDCVTVLNGINDRLVDLEQQLSTAAADRSGLPTGRRSSHLQALGRSSSVPCSTRTQAVFQSSFQFWQHPFSRGLQQT